MLTIILVSCLIALCLLNVFLACWWWTLFKDYQFGFIGTHGGRYEKTASIVIQCALPFIIGLVTYVIWIVMVYTDATSNFIVRLT